MRAASSRLAIASKAAIVVLRLLVPEFEAACEVVTMGVVAVTGAPVEAGAAGTEAEDAEAEDTEAEDAGAAPGRGLGVGIGSNCANTIGCASKPSRACDCDWADVMVVAELTNASPIATQACVHVDVVPTPVLLDALMVLITIRQPSTGQVANLAGDKHLQSPEPALSLAI